MAKITVPVTAFQLTLKPKPGSTAKEGHALPGLAGGQPMLPGWTKDQINSAFSEANAIWLRLAEIDFGPVAISDREETIPIDEGEAWQDLVRKLSHLTERGVVVGFVGQLIGPEGGWSTPPFSVISGAIALAETPQFAGRVLAHELGHTLLHDENHEVGSTDSKNLMHPKLGKTKILQGGKLTLVMSPPIITDEQKQQARAKAAEYARS